MNKDRIKYEFLKRKELIHIAQCNSKLHKLFKQGINTKDLFPGRFVNIEILEWIDKNHRQVRMDAGTPGIFVKLISSKTGNFYIYFGKDSSQDALVCDNPENIVVNNRFVQIFDNTSLLAELKGIKLVTTDFCRYYNDEIEFEEIFTDEDQEEQEK